MENDEKPDYFLLIGCPLIFSSVVTYACDLSVPGFLAIAIGSFVLACFAVSEQKKQKFRAMLEEERRNEEYKKEK